MHRSSRRTGSTFIRLAAIVSLVWLAIALLVCAATAQPSPDSAAHDTVSAGATSQVTGGGSGRDYIAEVRSNFTPENRRYSTLRSTLGFVGLAWDVAIGLLVLFTGLSARFRDIAHGRSGNLYVRMLIYLTLFTAVSFVLTLPLSWYRGFQIEHAFGLSTQSFQDWFLDELKGVAISLVALGVTGLLALAYKGIQKSPRRWWLWLAFGTLPVILITLIITPLVIDPLFNKFTPLRDQELKTKILNLAERAGIPGRNVYEVDKSKQTKKYNAYVSGWGVSQRIVLWDTTLKGMETDEILFVMAHEMGHYRLAHIWKLVGFSVALSFGLFFASGVLMRAAVNRFGSRWGFTELHDVASLPLFSLALTIVVFVADPLSNFVSRAVEHEADVFALEVTHDNDAGARTFLKLGSQNRSNPEPPLILKVMQYDHPPLIERIRFALEYRPWEEGKPDKLFHPVAGH